MIRKPFAFATLMAALSLMAGQQGPVKAQSTDTSVYDCSWATSLAGEHLLFNVRGQSAAGVAQGSFGASGAQWTSMGAFTSASSYHDSVGSHVEVEADLTFSHVMNYVRLDYIRGKADFKGLTTADGSQYEGVEITDLMGNVLYSTGRDAQGQIVMVKLTRGSLNVTIAAPIQQTK
jgi:hypothetical protein